MSLLRMMQKKTFEVHKQTMWN